MKQTLFVLSLALIISCTEKPATNTGGGQAVPDSNTEITVKADRKTMLRNPLSGWVIYAPLMDEASVEKFWYEYDHLNTPAGEVKLSDYATVLYLRGSMTDFNPEEGVYLWNDDIDVTKYPKAAGLKKFEEGAKERDLKLAFTLKTDSRDANAFCTPEYVREKMIQRYGGDRDKALVDYYGGSEKTGTVHTGMGFFIFSLGSTPRYYWSPYPDDPVFQECYGNFIRALAAEYNDPEKTMFISGLGMGLWGEYHTCIYSTRDEKPRQAVFEWVTDLYVDAFDKIPVVTNYHKLVGSTKGSGGADQLTPILLNSAIAKGFSMRHDAFGMKQGYGYGQWEKDFIANWTYKVPVLGEGGWVHKHDISVDYASTRELRLGEYEHMHSAYCNMMDLRYNSNVSEGETYSWFNDAFDLVVKFIEEGCYRIYPDKLSLPTTFTNGSEMTIMHRWLNIGHAYCPTNIKQYKDRFKVTFALLDPDTEKPVKLIFDENARPHEWTNGRKWHTLKTTVDDVPAGKYIWGTGIIDTAQDNSIGIHIGAKGDYTSEGWLKLSEVTVK